MMFSNITYVPRSIGYVELRPTDTCGNTRHTKITSAHECQNAAIELGFTWNNCCRRSDNEPYGCLVRIPVGDILFNGNQHSPTLFENKNRRAEVCIEVGLEIIDESGT